MIGDPLPAEVASDNAVPGGVEFFVELLLDVGGDVLLNVELLKGLLSEVDSLLLHLIRHVRIFHDGLPLLLAHGDVRSALLLARMKHNARNRLFYAGVDSSLASDRWPQIRRLAHW